MPKMAIYKGFVLFYNKVVIQCAVLLAVQIGGVSVESKNKRTEKPGARGSTAARAILYIESSDDLALGTEQIAAALGISKFYLCRVFKKDVGKTVSDFILEKRLSYADRLLLDGSLTVSDIARAVGYSSTSYFIKKYREYYGVSPGQRRNVKPRDGRN